MVPCAIFHIIMKIVVGCGSLKQAERQAVASRCPIKGRRKPLANRRENYFCTLVSEDVKISLKNRPSLSRELKSDLFVQCNQVECQYVDLNRSPCPLSLALFAEEIENREKKSRERRMEY